MKKIITLCIVLSCAIFAFAETHVAAGLRGSSLGLEPTLALCIDDFEAEIGCAMARNVESLPIYEEIDDKSNLILTPNITLGWNYDAFDSGWHNTLGFAYFCPMMFDKEKTISYSHIGGLSYRGSIKFRNNMEICGTSYLPFIVVNQDKADPVLFTIVDQDGIQKSIRYGFLMSSIGLRVSF